jgi:hypothetical protein
MLMLFCCVGSEWRDAYSTASVDQLFCQFSLARKEDA